MPSSWRILITATAEEHVHTIQSWWTTERTAAPELFLRELGEALERLASFPFSGAAYDVDQLPGVRRVILRRSGYHVYYTINDEAGEILIRAVWHAARGSGPDLA